MPRFGGLWIPDELLDERYARALLRSYFRRDSSGFVHLAVVSAPGSRSSSRPGPAGQLPYLKTGRPIAASSGVSAVQAPHHQARHPDRPGFQHRQVANAGLIGAPPVVDDQHVANPGPAEGLQEHGRRCPS